MSDVNRLHGATGTAVEDGVAAGNPRDVRAAAVPDRVAARTVGAPVLTGGSGPCKVRRVQRGAQRGNPCHQAGTSRLREPLARHGAGLARQADNED